MGGVRGVGGVGGVRAPSAVTSCARSWVNRRICRWACRRVCRRALARRVRARVSCRHTACRRVGRDEPGGRNVLNGPSDPGGLSDPADPADLNGLNGQDARGGLRGRALVGTLVGARPGRFRDHLVRGPAQDRELAIRELAQRSDRQLGVAERADRHPAQLLHRMRDAEEHLAHLSRAPFGELDREPGVAALFVPAAGALHPGDAARRGAPPLEDDPLAQAIELRLVRRPLHLHLVGLVAAVARMRDPLRELAVVGEQQQALGLVVEPPHRDQGLAPVLRHELNDRRPPGIVLDRGQVAARLVQQQVAMRSDALDLLVVDLDRVDGRIGLLAEHGDPSVDGDPPLAHQVFGLPAGSDAGSRQDLLQPLCGHDSSTLSASTSIAAATSSSIAAFDIASHRSHRRHRRRIHRAIARASSGSRASSGLVRLAAEGLLELLEGRQLGERLESEVHQELARRRIEEGSPDHFLSCPRSAAGASRAGCGSPPATACRASPAPLAPSPAGDRRRSRASRSRPSTACCRRRRRRTS